MNQRTIEVLIDPQGRTQVRTVGYAGPGCREASRFLEAALGAVQHERLTSEFYQAAAQSTAQQQRS